jgi:hypothetical protein
MFTKNKKIDKNLKLTKESSKDCSVEQGFITMIVMMLIILGVVIYLAYRRVSGA